VLEEAHIFDHPNGVTMVDLQHFEILELVKALKGGLEWLQETGENRIFISPQHPFFSDSQPINQQDKSRLIAQIPLPPPVPRIDIKDLPAVEQYSQVWIEKHQLISFELPPPRFNPIELEKTPALVTPVGLTKERVAYEKSLWKQYDQAVEAVQNPPKANKNQFWAQQAPSALPQSPSPPQIHPENIKNTLNQFIQQSKHTPAYQIGIPPQGKIPVVSQQEYAHPQKLNTISQGATPVNHSTLQHGLIDDPSNSDTMYHPNQSISSSSFSSTQYNDPQALEKQSKYLQIKQALAVCQKCPRCTQREVTIIGQGNLNQPIMFVDAYPSEVAKFSGLLLMENEVNLLFSKLLNAISLSREKVYITSLLKCGVDTPKLNDNPKYWTQCLQYFWQEVLLVKPKLIIGLGQLTHEIIFPERNSFFQYMGQTKSLFPPDHKEAFPYTPLTHPSALISANQSDKSIAWEHIKKIAVNYHLPIKKG
jgi:uracil-DNA glycosylase family 4